MRHVIAERCIYHVKVRAAAQKLTIASVFIGSRRPHWSPGEHTGMEVLFCKTTVGGARGEESRLSAKAEMDALAI